MITKLKFKIYLRCENKNDKTCIQEILRFPLRPSINKRIYMFH